VRGGPLFERAVQLMRIYPSTINLGAVRTSRDRSD
jgi:hypothetical protein